MAREEAPRATTGEGAASGGSGARSADRLSGAQWRTIVLASLGGALEFYDFIVYGLFAPAIAATFFPATDPVAGLVLAFSVFAGGYLARPFGGLLLGALGDRFGRRGVFLFSLGAISASTVLMGLLPGYAAWGVGATVLMVGLRLVQGLCLGGELPCSIVYAVETAPARGGFACGVLFFCVNSGVSLAALVSLGVNTLMPPAAAAAHGWRVAFVIGGATGLASLAIRRRLQESPDFAALRGTASRTPLRELFRGFPLPVLIGIGTSAATSAFNGMMFAYLPAHLVRVPSRRGCFHPRPSQTRTCRFPASGSSRAWFAQGAAYLWTIKAAGKGYRASMARKRCHGRLLWRPRRASHFFQARTIWW